MNRIRLLPEQLANQIAAGEVVERPASVVKELVENALDADAKSILVEVQSGGRSLIRVTDDGIGMNRDDALLCLERHATSKIRTSEDLHAITTMGFRGEAMPSIASVSRMSLTTRERGTGNPEATQIIIHGGKILEVKSAGAPEGTCMEVRQLFFNIPARRKFLRSDETERSHIEHYLILAALSHPWVGFTFRHDDRLIWQWPATEKAMTPASLLESVGNRLRLLHGNQMSLIPLDVSGELDLPSWNAEEPEAAPHIRVWGYIGAPGVSRATRQDQHLFVNRRPVENRGLNMALLEGYHTALMKGRFPVACLFIEIDPGEVDVNVHPSKREIKFRREQAVRRSVTQAVKITLLRHHSEPPAGATVAPAAEAIPLPVPMPDLPNLVPPLPSKPIESWPVRPAVPSTPAPVIPKAAVSAEPEPPISQPQPTPGIAPSSLGLPLLQVPLRLVGVIGRLYVVFESDRGMVLMDQHAAHERVLYEQMLKRMESGPAPSQRLLLPETVELSARDAQFLKENLTALTRLGMGLSEFGERTFLLDSIPPFIKSRNPRSFVIEVLDELKSAGREVNTMRLGEHMIAKTVCRHSVKANDPLAGPELEALLEDLRHCEMPYTCPHGRPTLIEMSFRELEKKFGRTQG